MNQSKPRQISWLDSTEHRDWFTKYREALLDLFQPEVVLSGVGYVYFDSRGHTLPWLGSQLWLEARMLYCLPTAAMQGCPGAEDVVWHSIGFYLDGAGRDIGHGGWFPTVGGDSPSFRKELYGQAHILPGASFVTIAGIPGGEDLFMAALEVIERFWVEVDGADIDAFDRGFHRAEPYRGRNANMHLAEAYLAAHEVTGDERFLERAARIACRIAGKVVDATEGIWQPPEHFDTIWRELPDHNRGELRYPFRPYGSQPGHWLEWSKLLLQIRGLGVRENWLLDASRHLSDGALQGTWASNGGSCYTVGWDGKPVVSEQFFWEIAEGIGAAAGLFHATGEQRYEDAYRTLWAYADEHVIDHVDGPWRQELDVENHPVTHTWEGKPDLYHAYQAIFYALLSENRGVIAWVRDQHRGGIRAG